MRRSHLMNFSLLAMSGILIVSFQNCSKVKFNMSPAVLKNEQDVLVSSSKVMIDDGAEYSNQKSLRVAYVSPRAVAMKRSTLPDCSDGDWVQYSNLEIEPVPQTNATNTVYAQFRDFHGNLSMCVSDEIVHDDTAPTGNFTNPTGLFTNLDQVKVTWIASDNLAGIAGVTCKDNTGSVVSCTDSVDAKNQVEGINTIHVTVRDRAGNESSDLAYSWYYDKTKPVLTLNTKLATITSAVEAALNFSAVDSGSGVASYTCKIDSVTQTGCISPLKLTALLEGSHHIELTATDKAGNVSDPVSFNWKVDLTAPSLKFTKVPAVLTNSTQAVFGYVAVDDGEVITNFECSLDNSPYAACGAEKSLASLGEGSHTFRVRAADSAGNLSQPISYTWTLDLGAPSLSFVSAPSALSNATSPVVTWVAKDPSGLASVRCSLDGTELGLCPDSTKTLPGLTEGQHVFQVIATDIAGNSKMAEAKWTTDLTAPVVSIASGPSKWTTQRTAAFEFTAVDAAGISSIECRLDNAAFTACVSPLKLDAISEGGHALSVRAREKAGNVSEPEIYSWSTDYSAPLIRIVSSPATLVQGGTASIQYQVADTGVGLNSVTCGLTSPFNSVGSCDAIGTADLGQLNQVGAYAFEIRAADRLGNAITEVVTIQVTNKPSICDPFSKANEQNCNGGFLGEIFYLTDTPRANFKALSNKTVDFFYANGTKVYALLNLKNINVPTRNFTEGFPTQSGNAIVDNNGNLLNEYFAFRLSTVAKLDPLIDEPGWYQVATLSDDGSVLNYKPAASAGAVVSGASPYVTLVSNDGDHGTRMGCSSKAIYVSDTSRIPMQLKYYQGPRTQIALVLIWRKVASETAALDTACGSSNYSANSGWKVMAPTNFIAPASYTN